MKKCFELDLESNNSCRYCSLFVGGEIYFVTCKSFNIREQNGHILVSVDVDLPELARHELALRSLLLEGDVFDQLLGHKRGQN